MNPQLSQFTAIIGIDWADTKHDICVQASNTDTREFSRILHKADKIHEWAQAMYQRYGGPMAVAVELDKGPIVSALQKYNFFVIYPSTHHQSSEKCLKTVLSAGTGLVRSHRHADVLRLYQTVADAYSSKASTPNHARDVLSRTQHVPQTGA